MITRLIRISIVLLAFFASHAARAVVIEITRIDDDLVRAVLTEIDAVEDRVFTFVVDENGATRIVFGDGAQGARPPSGSSGVSSYRFGAGVDGNIVNEYRLTQLEFPFIPIADFMVDDTGSLDISFVIVGVSSIAIEFSPDGLRVVDAKITPVPEPATLGLILAGLFAFCRRRPILPGKPDPCTKT